MSYCRDAMLASENGNIYIHKQNIRVRKHIPTVNKHPVRCEFEIARTPAWRPYN